MAVVEKSLFTLENEFLNCISRYISRESSRGKNAWGTLERVMRMWVSFAAAKVPRGNAKQIEDFYTGKFRHSKTIKRKKQSRLFMEYRESMALLFILLYYKEKRTGAKGDQLYLEARKYMNKRKYAVGVHRGGFKPAFARLGNPVRGTNLGKTPVYKNFLTGEIMFSPIGKSPTADEISITVTNFAKVIEEIAKVVFDKGMAEITELFNGYMLADMVKEQKAAGFITS